MPLRFSQGRSRPGKRGRRSEVCDSPSAREDILRQYRYYLIEVDEELVAERFLKAVQSAIRQVCRDPGIGAPKGAKQSKARWTAILASEGLCGDSRILPGFGRCGQGRSSASWQERHSADVGGGMMKWGSQLLLDRIAQTSGLWRGKPRTGASQSGCVPGTILFGSVCLNC